ncbi:hypothetical protein OUZ56_012940 [Daphnia magna]|uniref:CxC3 like cysteine cluster domain-containing protein n=1 Tax=Daphnia magna TaxID=35525 RepID=A0ABQ9Z4G2_9CRUS|nr:hypothetical protein OUZ56_012940 [Daphnia magna]
MERKRGKHAAKVAEEVATLILPAPEYLFDAYEDGRQGDGFLVDFATTEKEAIEENAAHIAGIEADKKKQESQWSKRVTIDNNTWNEFTSRLFGAFVSAEACDAERCDYYIEMRVFVPARCRTEKCKKLGTKGTLVLVAGTKHCTVISEEGRFHLHCASFKCSRCDGVMNAELEDYIGSGYWPGNPKTLEIFFMTLFLKLYFHLKNYLPEDRHCCSKKAYCHEKRKSTFIYDKGEIIMMSHEVCRLKRLHAGASSFERYKQDKEVQLGDGTLFIEAVESEKDSGDEDVTDNEVTFED